MAAVPGIEASTPFWGDACNYIVVNKVGAFIPVLSATATLLLVARGCQLEDTLLCPVWVTLQQPR
jgi:hypothetical protein